jgi:predicted dehydrogenase
MGPYYLTTLVHLLGPVRRVVALASRPRTSRTIGSGPRAGDTFAVAVDTHVTGLLEHASGALTTMIMSFDTWNARLPRIEVYGSDGSLSVPDPNYFAGDVALYTGDRADWRVLPPSAGYVGGSRGIGLLDLHDALAESRPHRASAEVALHVLDIMESMQAAADSGTAIEVTTVCDRPAPIDRLLGG